MTAFIQLGSPVANVNYPALVAVMGINAVLNLALSLGGLGVSRA